MSIVGVIIVFVLVGVALYLINTYVPMDAGVKKMMNVVVLVLLGLWILFALLGDADIAMPTLGRVHRD